MFNKKKYLLSLAVIAALSGCSPYDNDNNLSSSFTTGNVVDGYIKNATVCLDLNKNNTCDTNEPMTTTNENGAFELTWDKDITLTDDTPLLSYGGINTATGAPFNAILKAPQEYENITPASTLVQSYIEQGHTQAEATTKVATLLNVKENDLQKDPVAEFENNPKLLQANVKLQNIITILSDSTQENTEVFSTLAKAINESENFEQLIDKSVTDETLKTNLQAFNENIDSLSLSKDDKTSFENTTASLALKIKDAKKNNETIDVNQLFSNCQLNPNLDDSNVTDTPPNNGENIPYFTVGSKVADIEAAFNYARTKDSTISTKLHLPSQDIWDKLPAEEQALFILNRERIDRGLKPFNGVETMSSTQATTLSQASSLAEISQAYANLLYKSTSLSHTLDGTVEDRIKKVTSLQNNTDFIQFDESLYAEGNSYKLDEAPLIKAIYNWIYADKEVASGEAWGHRAMCLQKISDDNSGKKGAEGIIAFGLKQGENSSLYPNFKTSIVVMNAFNPNENYSQSYLQAPLCLGKNLQNNRFTEENGTITDTQTQLTWQDINQTQATLSDAKEYCKALTLNGFNDWRIPTSTQLVTFYTAALDMGITPNLSQINATKFVADGGFILTQEGATKYDKKLGDIETAFDPSTTGEVKCVRGQEVISTTTQSSLTTNENSIIDQAQQLTFANQPSLAGRYGIYYAEIACSVLELDGFDDWQVPTPTQLSNFHKSAKENNISLNYYASYCTYETTNQSVDDKTFNVVRVQSDDEDGLSIGDIANFTGSAGVRCVRNTNPTQTLDTTPPKRAIISSDASNLLGIKFKYQKDLVARTYIQLKYDCSDDDNGVTHCQDFNFTLTSEPNATLYSLDSHGKLDKNLGKFDENGTLVIEALDSQRSYSTGINTTADHYFDQIGEYVSVDDANNTSKINTVFVEFIPTQD